MATTFRDIESYNRDEIKSALDSALNDIGGLDKYLNDKTKILIKPNFVVAESHLKGSTTHPDFYMAVAEYLMAHGKQVTIGESPAFGSAQMTCRSHGVYKECKDKGIDIITFKKAESYEGLEDKKQYRNLSIAKELNDFDAMINLPKLKVHQQFVFTGATKNLYGCVTGKRKAYRHFVCENNPQLFARMILANAEMAKPVLNFGDGIMALHKRGPRNGEPYPLHKIILSDSYLEFDWLFCEMIKLDQMQTPLFQVLSDDERDQLKSAIAPLLARMKRAGDDFQLSEESDIAFSAGRVIKSVWKSIKTGS